MNYTFLQSIKVIAGNGQVKNVGTLLKEAGYQHPLLVYDKGVEQAGIIHTITESLKAEHITYTEFSKVLPDPPAGIVEEGYQMCLSKNCDSVIAVGGGSSIDTGKGINLLRVNGGSILEYADPEKEIKPCAGLISIPTTSGTGSELSNGLIISDTKQNKKVAILAQNAMSEFAVIDPSLTLGMPAGLTMMTGLDVFSHAAEGYTSVLSTIATDMVCEKIMETVVTYLPRALADGQDMEARTRMHTAASLGGFILANASAHVGHSFAHALGGIYHLPHGACCAYGFPSVLKLIASSCPEKVKKIGEILGAAFTGTESTEEIGEISASAYMKFRDSILGLKPLEIEEPDIAGLAKAVMEEPLAALCPVPIDEKTVLRLLRDIFPTQNVR